MTQKLHEYSNPTTTNPLHPVLYTDTEHYPQILTRKWNLTISSLGLASLPVFAVIDQCPDAAQ